MVMGPRLVIAALHTLTPAVDVPAVIARLDRAIEYAAAHGSIADVSGLLAAPLEGGHDN